MSNADGTKQSGKARKRFTIQTAAEAAMAAGLGEEATKKITANMEQNIKSDDEDEPDDSFADAVRVPTSAPSSASAPAAGGTSAAPVSGEGDFAEQIRILKAKVENIEQELARVTIDAYKNTIRLAMKGRIKLPEFHQKLKYLNTELVKIENVIQVRVSAYSEDVVFKLFDDPRRETERVREILRKQGVDGILFVVPPPAPNAHALSSVPTAVYKTVMECFDMECSDPLEKHPRLKTMRPIPEARAPMFSISAGDQPTFVSGKFGLRQMTVEITIKETFSLGMAKLKGLEVAEHARTVITSAFKLIFVVVPAGAAIQTAPNFRELKEARGLKKR